MDILSTLLTLVTVLSANYGSEWYKRYLDRKARQKSQNDNMDQDYHRAAQVIPLLEDLRQHLGADRVVECAFSNGDTTLGGYHMKKVSVLTETVPLEGEERLAPHFQLIPAKKFDRTLSALFEAREDWSLTDERAATDHTAILNRSFSINYLLLVTVRNEYGKWIGYLAVCWSKSRLVSRMEIERVKLVADRLGSMKP
jgi:hypothetical protein